MIQFHVKSQESKCKWKTNNDLCTRWSRQKYRKLLKLALTNILNYLTEAKITGDISFHTTIAASVSHSFRSIFCYFEDPAFFKSAPRLQLAKCRLSATTFPLKMNSRRSKRKQPNKKFDEKLNNYARLSRLHPIISNKILPAAYWF